MSTNEKQFHIALAPGDVGEYCLLPGDPGRCEAIASLFQNSRLVGQNREFTTYTGTLDGVKVSVTSTGIGGPSAVIAMQELAAIGVKTFLRVGTCGGIAQKVLPGDLVIATGAVRQEGTSKEFAPIEFPACADFDVVYALRRATAKLGLQAHTGILQCKDSFYGQHHPEQMPVSYELLNKWEAWKRLGVLASEMESAALFVCASMLEVRCGCICSTFWNQERKKAGITDEPDCKDTSNAIKAAVEALRLLIQEDQS